MCVSCVSVRMGLVRFYVCLLRICTYGLVCFYVYLCAYLYLWLSLFLCVGLCVCVSYNFEHRSYLSENQKCINEDFISDIHLRHCNKCSTRPWTSFWMLMFLRWWELAQKCVTSFVFSDICNRMASLLELYFSTLANFFMLKKLKIVKYLKR